MSGRIISWAILLGTFLAAPMAAGEWELVWSDEFDGDTINTDVWQYEEGFLRNNEEQYYTKARPENARIEDGKLILEARKEEFKNEKLDFKSKNKRRHQEMAHYTSASINTRDKMSWQYGRVEIRAKLPQGKGVWPAAWMLGDKIKDVGWPKCGEIDIMEYVGKDRDDIHGTVHYYGEGKHLQNGKKTCSFRPFEQFHIFAIEWNEEKIDFYLDKTKYHTFKIDKAGKGPENPFRQPQYLLLNFALGGNWGGKIDDKILPQKYIIDYVRVYKEKKEAAKEGEGKEDKVDKEEKKDKAE
ncbi:MAG: glycoside hydrolase family 16 protein [Planctomycetes bacterium]|nr:glycoside hydrolase family 16 protein [Planctomycetota bacterium]